MPNKFFTSNLKTISFSAVFLLLGNAAFSRANQYSGGGFAATGQIAKVGYTSEIYDATSGLPTSDANFVLGAKNGYVWIGGYSGIIRYNGSIFDRLPTSFGLTSGRGLFEDSKERIWVATNDNGVVVLDGEKTRHYTYKDGLPSSSIRIFSEDNNGNIFIGTTAGLAYIDKSGKLYPINDARLNKERILKLSSDYNGRVYGHTKNGKIFVIDDCEVTRVYTSEELGMEKITTIMSDPANAGKLYFGTQGSLIYYGDFGRDSSQLKKIDVSPLSDIHWLSYDCDRVWISSATSIGYLDKKNQFHELKNIPMDSGIEMTTSDYQGNIWVASSTQGVMKIVTNNFVNLSKEASLPLETTNATCFHDDKLYIGTDHGLKIITKDHKVIKNELTEYIGTSRIRCIIEDSQKNLWIAAYTNNLGLVCCTPEGKITSFTKKDGMPGNQIRCLKESKNGAILAGTTVGLGVVKDGKVIRSVTTENGVKNAEFLTIEEDDDGNIYAGSDGDGIYIIGENKIERIGRDEGLTSDVVMRIKKDKVHGVYWLVTSNSIQYIQNGAVKNVTSFPYNNNYDLYMNSNDECWILSSYGVFRVKTTDLLSDSVKDYRIYTIANGLPCSITSNSYSALNSDGTLYISAREGVVRVNIDHYFDRGSQIKVDLNSIYCDDQKISPNQSGIFVLPASKGRIKLTPSVMDYSMANPLVRIYLEGSKDSGITVQRNNLSSLEYTALSYGNYILHIQILDNGRTSVLLDKTYMILKKPRLSELYIFRMSLIVFLILMAGFIVWRVMKSTVITRQYEVIRKTKDEAERANTARSRFLSNMTQEILNPINTIMGMNEMILREETKGVPKSYFMSIANYAFDIKTSSDSLFTIVNDLLEMTKIESGKLQLVQQEYDMSSLLKNIVSFIREKTTEKELKFDVVIDEMIPKRLYGDLGKIKQIVLNLLSNAVKYTEKGGITLKLTMESRTDNVCGLCISVKDTGSGIKQEEVEAIFATYENIVEAENTEHMKTGLGLNISRKFAELMGGVLVCQSNPGEGSEFIFAFEQKIVDSSPIGQFNEQDEAIQKGPYIPHFIAPDADILVVDDNLMNIHVISNLLKATKVFVSTASSCEDCLVKIRNNSFNIVFINENISGIDGEETIQKIREIAPELPVYALIENSSSGEDFYKSKGFDGCLPIPVDYDLMELTIMRQLPEAMMDRPTKNDKMEVISEFPEEMLWIKEIEGISVPDGVKASGGIGSLIFALKLFYETISDNAKDINHAYQTGNFKVLAVKLRILKNSTMFVGAKDLYELALKLEEACKKDDRIFIAANIDRLLHEYTAFNDKLSRFGEAQGDTANV
ncbi:ATP-binding protein [uncultured Treponema sp.]|uniref:hybrid sensor histidine kinase/response regulator n=1 Tax=uncultured Treponema sp. TaxID=162155 RepID=UPI0025E40F54|nr:ATP-binding protein [uncultured Treponema sp.]